MYIGCRKFAVSSLYGAAALFEDSFPFQHSYLLCTACIWKKVWINVITYVYYKVRWTVITNYDSTAFFSVTKWDTVYYKLWQVLEERATDLFKLQFKMRQPATTDCSGVKLSPWKIPLLILTVHNACPPATNCVFHRFILFSNNLTTFSAVQNICKHLIIYEYGIMYDTPFHGVHPRSSKPRLPDLLLQFRFNNHLIN